MNTNIAAKVLNQFYRHQLDATSPRIEFLDSAGGFSGAAFWKIVDGRGEFCLRRWPIEANDDQPRLKWIHRQLDVATAAGCDFVPVPLGGFQEGPQRQDSLIEYRSHFWQLEPWMPGKATFHAEPTERKLVAAMEALANFHSSVRKSPLRRQPSPGILSRIRRLSELFDGVAFTDKFLQIEDATDSYDECIDVGDLGYLICMYFRNLAGPTLRRLNQFKSTAVEIQTIIGDIWHDHVLFTDDEVTGIVDFGAMRMDTPAADVARLLSSLVGESVDLSVSGLNAYQNSAPEYKWTDTKLIDAFDCSTTVLAGMNWLQWLCVENRQFTDMAAVCQRLRMIARRMDFLVACL